VHFEVYPDQARITDASNAIATSQLALPQDVCEQVYATAGYAKSVENLAQVSLQTDNVFGDDGAVHQLATVSGDMEGGFAVSLAVGSTPQQPRAGVGRLAVPRPPADQVDLPAGESAGHRDMLVGAGSGGRR
jgi:hypothetical protein